MLAVVAGSVDRVTFSRQSRALEQVTVTVLRAKGRVWLGIIAPPNIRVDREEIRRQKESDRAQVPE